jgi:hypothetical protein
MFVLFFVIPLQFQEIGCAVTCTEDERCDLCLQQSGCHFGWDFEGRGICMENDLEEYLPVSKIARNVSECPSGTFDL